MSAILWSIKYFGQYFGLNIMLGLLSLKSQRRDRNEVFPQEEVLEKLIY